MSRLDKKEEIIALASRLHEDWRKPRLKDDGTYEPRWKKIKKDKEFIANSKPCDTIRITPDGVEVDIANTSFIDLPFDYQEENLLAAEVVVNILKDKKCLTAKEIEELSDIVHEEWLKRNTWAKGGELDIPYKELPEVEKAKDRVQVLSGMEVLGIPTKKR